MAFRTYTPQVVVQRERHPLAQGGPETMVPLAPELRPAAQSANGLKAQPVVSGIPTTSITTSTQTSAGNPMRTDLTHDLDGVFATRNLGLADAQVRSGNSRAQVTPYLGNVKSKTGLFGLDLSDPKIMIGVGIAAVAAVYFLRKKFKG